MKHIHFIIICLVFGSLLWANEADVEQMMGELASFSVPMDKAHVSVNPGFVYSATNPGFPMIAVNIPFAGNYYLSGEIGAGTNYYEQGGLNLFAVGLGYYQLFANFEDLYFDLGVSYRNMRSQNYSSDILSGALLIEQKLYKIFVGVGAELKVQDIEIVNSNLFPDMNDRLTKLLVNIRLRSPLGNIEIKGTPDNIIAGMSWTLKLDK